jgi:hypothetical protein
MTAANEELKAKTSLIELGCDTMEMLYESGIFTDVRSKAQVFVKILAGRELGLNTIQSMNSVYIVQGKIGVEVKIYLAKLKQGNKYDYRAGWDYTEEGLCRGARVEFFKLGVGEGSAENIGVSVFTYKDAVRCGLANKEAYKKYPELMMFYRAASNGMKMFCPDVLSGGAVYEDFIEMTGKSEPTEIRLPSRDDMLNMGMTNEEAAKMTGDRSSER